MSTSVINDFKGFSLHPFDALKNIACLIECGRILSVANDGELAETGDVVIDFARQYALAAYYGLSGQLLRRETDARYGLRRTLPLNFLLSLFYSGYSLFLRIDSPCRFNL